MRKTPLIRKAIRPVVTAMVALLIGGMPATAAHAADPAGAQATFEGTVIDMSQDWGEATACVVWDAAGVRECFRTEAEMDLHVAGIDDGKSRTRGAPADPGLESLQSQCSSSVKLYDGIGYTGSVLYLRDRSYWINLSSYGFSNRTTSFKIGACSSYFADYNNGGGSWYSTSATQAYDVAYATSSGWNNRVSSIYIN